MVTGLESANLAVRFFLELCALGALGYWGVQAGNGPLAKTGLGLGAPLLAAAVWGTFVAPGASVGVPGPLHLALQVAVFGAAVAALAVTGHRSLALAFGLVAVINAVLLYAWGQ